MNRPSKKEIAERVRQLKQSASGEAGEGGHSNSPAPRPQEKKANKNRIRKKGV